MADEHVTDPGPDSGGAHGLLHPVAQVVGTATTGRNAEFLLPDHTRTEYRCRRAGSPLFSSLRRRRWRSLHGVPGVPGGIGRLAVPQPDGLGLAEPGDGDHVDVVILHIVDWRDLLAGTEVRDEARDGVAVADDQDYLALVLLQDRIEHRFVIVRIVAVNRQVQ